MQSRITAMSMHKEDKTMSRLPACKTFMEQNITLPIEGHPCCGNMSQRLASERLKQRHMAGSMKSPFLNKLTGFSLTSRSLPKYYGILKKVL